jgi:hypothetical protein
MPASPRRILGTTGVHISPIGLGCMGMSDFYGKADDAASTALLHHALDSGVNFFDSADMYGPWTNERLLGAALRARRDEAVIATKFGVVRTAEGGFLGINGTPAYVRSACDASLASQVWHMTAAGQVVSNATGQCLGNNNHWLWDWKSQLALTGCNPSDAQQLWQLRAADGALVLPAASVCAGSSDVSGPASQVWRKPLQNGAVAVLVVNGALIEQTVSVSLADLNVTSATASARDLWARADLPVVTGAFSVVVAAHDSAMLLLTPL